MSNLSRQPIREWQVVQEELDSGGTRHDKIAIGMFDSEGLDRWLLVGFNGTSLFFGVSWNLEIGISVKPPVSWNIDNGPWRRRRGWILSTDHKWTLMPDSKVMDMIMALSGARELIVRVYPFGKNPIETNFHVGGIETAVPPKIKAESDYWEYLENWVEEMGEIDDRLA